MVVQSIGLVTDLRSQNKNIGVLFMATGQSVSADGGGGTFFWNASSTTADDGVNCIQVTGVTTGRWVRLDSNISVNIYNSNGTISDALRTVTMGSSHIAWSGTTSASGTFYTITSTQTSVNATDTGDTALSVSQIISASSASNQLVTRSFSFTTQNNLTGGGAITNMRVVDIQVVTNSGTTATDNDIIYVLGAAAANGTVTNQRGVLIRNMQGVNRAAFVAENIAQTTPTAATYVLLGTRTIPIGFWGIYQSGSYNNFFSGNILMGSISNTGLARLQVTGAIQQTSVLSSLLKANSSGVLVAAIVGTDYVTTNIYNSSGTISAENRTVSVLDNYSLKFISSATDNFFGVEKFSNGYIESYIGNGYYNSGDVVSSIYTGRNVADNYAEMYLDTWSTHPNPGSENKLSIYTYSDTNGAYFQLSANGYVTSTATNYNNQLLIDTVGFKFVNVSNSTTILDEGLLKLDGSYYLKNAVSGTDYVAPSRTLTINGVTYDLTANRSWTVAGGVTSVGLSMPSAFTVSSSPVTSSGTLTVVGAGSSAQYIDGTGALQTFPTLANSDKLIHSVRNNSGATITKGTIVYINGAVGNKPTIAKALATSDATSAQTYGLVQADIANNADGNVVVVGDVENLNTFGIAEGTQLYLSGTTAGTWTTTKPYAPTHLVYVGVVLREHVNFGIVGVKIQNGYEMDELHNVDAYLPSNNDGLFYNTTTSLWEHKSIATVLGYTPFNLPSLTSGSVLFSNGTTIAQDNANFFWDDTNNRLGIGTATPSAILHTVGSITASSAIARGNYMQPTLVAAANSDVLVGLDINPTFTNGAFTGVTNYSLRVGGSSISQIAGRLDLPGNISGNALTFTGNAQKIGLSNADFTNSNTTYIASFSGNSPTDLSIKPNGSGTASSVVTFNAQSVNASVGRIGVDSTSSYIQSTISGTGTQLPLDIKLSSTTYGRFFITTGNFLLQNGGTFTDAGYKLDVNGTARVSDNLLVSKNQNGQTSVTVSNTTNSTTSEVGFLVTSDAASGTAAFGKYSTLRTIYKIVSGKDSFIYNASAGDISILNDYTSGKIKFAAGGSSTSQLEIASNGTLTSTANATAASAIARGANFTPTLVAAANSDVLVGLDINPTFTNGAFTGVSNIGLRVVGSDAVINTVNIGLGGGSIATNTRVGVTALNANTTGSTNTAVGYESLLTVSTGVQNTAIGYRSGRLATANQGTFVGDQAGVNVSSGGGNVLIGYTSGQNITTGSFNAIIGTNTRLGTTSSSNAILGSSSGTGITGNNNVFIGQDSGRYYSASNTAATAYTNSIMIGYSTKQLADNQTNQIVIGYQETGLGSNTTIIGNSSTVTTAIRGRLLLGTTTDSGSYQLDVNGTARVSGDFTAVGSGTFQFPTAKTTGINITGLLILTNDATNPQGLVIGYNGNATAANRRININTSESGIANNGILSLQSNGGTLTVGATSILTTSSRFTVFGTTAKTSATESTIAFFGTSDASPYGLNINVVGDATNANRSIRLQTVEFGLANGGTLIIQASTGSVVIGTNTPNASAKLQVDSTTLGFLPPRMTTTQKTAIATPAAGLMVFDTTLVKLCVYSGTAWETITSL